MIKLTISIVNYNLGDYLIKCLESIQKVSGEAEISVYVVDNNSSDGSIEKAKGEFKDVNFILNKENLGFGSAHNKVLKNLKTDYVLILNPDCELEKGVLKRMISFMEDYSEVGAASCKVLLENGSLDKASHRGFPTPRASLLYFLGDDSLYHLSKEDINRPHEVDSISGAFFLTRKSVLEKVGLFDEDYFMYAEDIDLCYRIKQGGFKVMYVPDVQILHHKGVASGLKKHTQEITTADRASRKKALDSFYETMKFFYKKHYEKNYPSFINWLVYFGINLRWFLAKRKMVV